VCRFPLAAFEAAADVEVRFANDARVIPLSEFLLGESAPMSPVCLGELELANTQLDI
jgi:hypothetical protein